MLDELRGPINALSTEVRHWGAALGWAASGAGARAATAHPRRRRAPSLPAPGPHRRTLCRAADTPCPAAAPDAFLSL